MNRWILAAACGVAALGLMLYPLAGELVSEKYHSDVETTYTAAIEDTDAVELTAQRESAAKEASALAERQRATAKAEADKIIEAARAEGERERKKIVDDANREAVAIAEAAMDKLVNEHTSAAYDDFLKTVEGESK